MIETFVDQQQVPYCIVLIGDKWQVLLLVSKSEGIEALTEKNEGYREMKYPSYSIRQEYLDIFNELYEGLTSKYPRLLDGSMTSDERISLVVDTVSSVPNGEVSSVREGVIRAIRESLIGVRCVERTLNLVDWEY